MQRLSLLHDYRKCDNTLLELTINFNVTLCEDGISPVKGYNNHGITIRTAIASCQYRETLASSHRPSRVDMRGSRDEATGNSPSMLLYQKQISLVANRS